MVDNYVELKLCICIFETVPVKDQQQMTRKGIYHKFGDTDIRGIMICMLIKHKDVRFVE